MANTRPPLPARQLLDVLRPPQGAQQPTESQADKAVRDFLALLTNLEGKHARRSLSNEYLISNVFGRSRSLKNDAERGAYCRSHLKVAVRQLSKLIAELEDPTTKLVTAAVLVSHKEMLRDYVFDLAEIIPYLERKDPSFVYLEGGKNPTVHSWEVYLLSKQLAYQSSINPPRPLPHKTAQIASIFVLRQSLELRFERLIGVYLEDRKGKKPRLWHGFHQEFIAAYPQYFRCNGFNIKEIQPVYDWCSEVVHLAYQPFAWQITWALELCGQLLGTRQAPVGGAWNIANAVELPDVEAMQAEFENYFLHNYDHGSWRMTRTRPEALVKNWKSTMAFTSPDLRLVSRRMSLRGRIFESLSCIWSRVWPF